jgi:hypothetical protein
MPLVCRARVAELVDATDSKSVSSRSAGSSPALGTTQRRIKQLKALFYTPFLLNYCIFIRTKLR